MIVHPADQDFFRRQLHQVFEGLTLLQQSHQSRKLLKIDVRQKTDLSKQQQCSDTITGQWQSNRTHTPPFYSHYTGQPAPPVKKWMILLVHNFTACMPLLTATSASELRRRCWSSPWQ